MRCSKCGTENPERAKFCVECASAFARRCRSCNAENPPTAKFCLECAKPLDQAGSETEGVTHQGKSPVRLNDRPVDTELEGERKTVTALFADIKGSMDLIEDIDPEEARAIVDPALKRMINAAQHFGGYIVQSTGDGILAIFGAPIAYEDHPQRALLAGLRMQVEIVRYAEKLRAEKGLNLQVRIGANTGEVVVREIRTGEKHTEYTPIGHSISVAARLQALAAPGSIAIGEPVRKLIEGYFTLKPIGPARIKGVSEPVNVYEVTGLGPLRTRLQRSATRGYTRFVGREREMEALSRAAEQAKTEQGQIVAAIAEAGIGKSRLFHEFKARNQSGWMILEAISFPHGRATAYLPLIELLHDYFAIELNDEPRRRREKVAGKVAILDRSLEDALPYLFALLGIVEGEDPLAQMDAQIRRRRTQEAVKRLLLRESLNQPLMIVFEDLHWIDGETQAFLGLLAEGIANAPVLLLVNYRPEYTHQWGSKTYYTQLRLDPLGKESAAEMLKARIGDAPELAPLKRLVLERTEGNPLFIEELVEALFEEGVLVRNGTVKVTRSLNQLKIPPTIHGILAARIDRLSSEEKELLQTLAVIGSEFKLAVVRQVVQLPADRLDQLLEVLQSGEFIYEQPASDDIQYKFKHALTHDEASKSLLTERRKLLHERTAQAIEELFHERLDDHYADLAHHYGSSDNAAKAVEYLRLAGHQAVDRGAYARALANVESSLRLIERLHEGVQRLRAELGVRQLEGSVAPTLYGLASAERLQSCERVCELSERLGDASALLLGLANVGFVHHFRLELPRALEIARRCTQVVEANLNGETPPYIKLLSAVCAIDSGDWLQARSLFTDMMERVRSPHERAATEFRPWNLWVVTPDMFSYVQLELGRPDSAVKLSNEGLRRSRELNDPYNAAVTMGAGILRYHLREPQAARTLAEAASASAEENGLRDLVAVNRLLHDCWAVAQSGQVEMEIDELEAKARLVPGYWQMKMSEILARIRIDAGQPERALPLLDEALDKNERLGVHELDAELHRLRGEAILMRDPLATAESEICYRKAIEVACGQSAKWWELRATVSLARLLRDTKRPDEARAMLAEMYNWFTEGFDTADLKEAKALLGELGA